MTSIATAKKQAAAVSEQRAHDAVPRGPRREAPRPLGALMPAVNVVGIGVSLMLEPGAAKA
ncbi:hypothetical protein [Streptomyces sp. DW26H14]|uniref:hypothetical protein n=1 Tax=Streptomyces sp. DW26H14 TaxID=3435395 RepID=UPI00403DFEAB